MLNNLNMNIFFKNKNEPFSFVLKQTIEKIHNIINDILILKDTQNYYTIKTIDHDIYFNINDIVCLFIISLDDIEKYKYDVILYHKSISKEVKIPFINKISINDIKYLDNSNFIKIYDKKTLLYSNDISSLIIKNKNNVIENNVNKKKIKKNLINKEIINNDDDFDFKIIEDNEKMKNNKGDINNE